MITNPFKRKVATPQREVAVAEYPAIVQEIHHEFETAGEKLLAEANEILSNCDIASHEKGNRLLALGFKQAQQAVEVSETNRKQEYAKEVAECVQDYAIRYPYNKFITDEMVTAICEKYSLVCGNISRYKGFVPDAKLKLIENFKLQPKEQSLIVVENVRKDSSSIYTPPSMMAFDGYIHTERGYSHIRKVGVDDSLFRAFQSDNGVDFYARDDKDLFGMEKYGWLRFSVCNELKICAPQKDMDTRGMEIVNKRLVHFPDPVVLQPVRGGFLILCAWGDEASDPIVVNQTLN